MRVFAIIPAHNEEDGIEETLLSLIDQTYKIEEIVVACDNCSDGTEAIVERISRDYPSISYFSTVNNKSKKAGAMNQAFAKIKDEEWDALFHADADTIFYENSLEEAVKELKKSPKTGAVCTRYRSRDYNGGNYFLYTLQYIESCLAHSTQTERKMRATVLSGVATLIRKEALLVFGKEVWDENAMAEDFILTLDLQGDGWNVIVAKDMYVETDYMRTLGDLWRQRRRWSYGTLEGMILHGWKSYTKSDIVQLIIYSVLATFQFVFIIGLLYLIFSGQIDNWGWTFLGIAVPVILILNKAYRSKYIKKKSFFNLFVANMIIPEYCYGLFLYACLVSASFRFLFGMKPKW